MAQLRDKRNHSLVHGPMCLNCHWLKFVGCSQFSIFQRLSFSSLFSNNGFCWLTGSRRVRSSHCDAHCDIPRTQARGLPPCQGIRVQPSGRFPSFWTRPGGSFHKGTADSHLRHGVSRLGWELACRPSHGSQWHQPNCHSGKCVVWTAELGTQPLTALHYYFLTLVLSSWGMKRLHCAVQKSTKINLEWTLLLLIILLLLFLFFIILNPCTQLPGNEKIYDNNIVVFISVCLQCFDAVGWVAGRASGL